MKCLIVDDDVLSRKSVTSMLQEHASCDEAAEGRTALAQFTQALRRGEPYDLVILDLDMPGMSGHDTAKRIREVEREMSSSGKVHIIILSMLNSVNDAMESFCKGQTAAFMLKPVRREVLHEVIANLGLLEPARCLIPPPPVTQTLSSKPAG